MAKVLPTETWYNWNKELAKKMKRAAAEKTGAPLSSKGAYRCWMVTIFDMDWAGPQVQHPHFRYFVAQKEKAPDTGRLHWQGYVEVKEKCRIKKMKEVLGCPSAHLEPRRGSQEEAIAYCTKEESRAEPYEKMEHGTKAASG